MPTGATEPPSAVPLNRGANSLPERSGAGLRRRFTAQGMINEASKAVAGRTAYPFCPAVLEPEVGFEPTTFRLRVGCATTTPLGPAEVAERVGAEGGVYRSGWGRARVIASGSGLADVAEEEGSGEGEGGGDAQEGQVVGEVVGGSGADLVEAEELVLDGAVVEVKPPAPRRVPARPMPVRTPGQNRDGRARAATPDHLLVLRVPRHRGGQTGVSGGWPGG
jgi:hypothetical protein